MFRKTLEKQPKKKTLFEIVYQLAIDEDEKELRQKIKEGFNLNTFQGTESLGMLLAKKGNHKAVTFLIDKFDINRNHVIWGYAIGGYVEKVNELIKNRASLDYAVKGYAYGGHVIEVNKLIMQGASRDFAAGGYAYAGNKKEVDELIRNGAGLNDAVGGYAYAGNKKEVDELIKQGASVNEAIQNYARGGYTKEVNELILQGASRDKAVVGYERGNYVAEENILPILSNTDDPNLRILLVDKLKKTNYTVDLDELLVKATILNQVIREKQLDFEQAQLYVTEMNNKGVMSGQS